MSKAGVVSLAILLALWMAPSPGLAQEAEEKATEKVSLGEAAEEIARRGKVNVLLVEEVAKREVVPPGSGSWRVDLFRCAEEAEAVVWPLGGETFVLAHSGSLNVGFDDADCTVVFYMLASNAGANVVIAGSELGAMDLDAAGNPMRLLDQIARERGLVVPRERGWICRISTPENERRISTRPLAPETRNALGLGYSKPECRRRFSFDVKEKRASAVLKQISKVVGLPITIDERIDHEPITLKLDEAPWREALEAIAWVTGGAVWDDGKGSISIRQIPRITMQFQGAEIAIVVDLIARNSKITLEVDEAIAGTCTMNIRNVAWRDLLYALSRNQPFHLGVKPDGTLIAEPF